jgi:hypothetical protein
MSHKAFTKVLSCIFLLWAAVPVLYAQGTASARITGRVVDESGAPVPGINIAVTSPVLQVSRVAAATDADGSYRFLDLPAPGVFKVTFSRDGFQTFVRGDVNLSVGFDARVDVAMKVGHKIDGNNVMRSYRC